MCLRVKKLNLDILILLPDRLFFQNPAPATRAVGWKLIFSIFHQLREFSKKGPILGLRQFLITENPLKMMRNAFYFVFLFKFLEIFTFCRDFLVVQKNGLMGKLWLISKF